MRGDDLANELPEIQRTLGYLVPFKDLFNIAIGYQKIVSTPANHRPPVPSRRITLRARLLNIKSFMTDDCHQPEIIHSRPASPDILE